MTLGNGNQNQIGIQSVDTDRLSLILRDGPKPAEHLVLPFSRFQSIRNHDVRIQKLQSVCQVSHKWSPRRNLMLIKVCRFLATHTAVALLDHLGIRNQSVKCEIDSLCSHHGGHKFLQSNDNGTHRILGFEILVDKAIEIQCKNVGIYASTVLLNMLVCSEKRCYIERNTHSLFFALCF